MTPFTVHHCEQRTPEWMAARCGRLTGSRAEAAFAKTKTNPRWTKDRDHLRTSLVLERLTGQPQERDVRGQNVRDGIAREPFARFHYECLTGTVLRTCGFVSDNELPIGCSPDGYVGDFEGLVSIKCPPPANHLHSLLKYREWQSIRETAAGAAAVGVMKSHLEVIPEEYLFQIRHEMYVTGASWLDYMSYDPNFPPHLRSVLVRTVRSDFDFDAYEGLVLEFLSEVDAEHEQILGLAA